MRSKFKSTGPIPVSEILLDQNNYRLGPLENQIDCIEIMLKEFGSKMTKLAGHIAKNGLSPKPVVVSKDEQGRWVVRDGNRRIAVLKLLNNPAEAPDKYKHPFHAIKKTAAPGIVPDKIDCLTADEATIIEYRKLEHMGPQEGVGQVDWDARAKENLQADMDGKLRYPLAGAVCEYLEKKGVTEAGRGRHPGRPSNYKILGGKREGSYPTFSGILQRRINFRCATTGKTGCMFPPLLGYGATGLVACYWF